MTNQYKDISANIGKTYDNLCQLIGENYTGNPEQVLTIKIGGKWVIQPFTSRCVVFHEYNENPEWDYINGLFNCECTLLEDLTPAPKNPNVIETVEELYERVKEAHLNGKALRLLCGKGGADCYSTNLVGVNSDVYFLELVKFKEAIKLGFKVEVVE